MMTGITRRRLLLGGAVAAIVPATVVTGTAVTGTLITPHQKVIIAYLRHKLPGLAVNQIDLEDHVRRFTSPIPFENRRFYYRAILSVMDNPALEPTLVGALRDSYEAFTRGLMTGFLLSTDFFTTAGAQPTRTSYIAYRDPYELGCSNPLARLVGTS